MATQPIPIGNLPAAETVPASASFPVQIAGAVFLATAAQLAAAAGIHDGADGQDGTDGTDGRGIASVIKTGTEGNVDTYTITFTDDSTSTFTVTNGNLPTGGTEGQVLTLGAGGAAGWATPFWYGYQADYDAMESHVAGYPYVILEEEDEGV